MGSQSLVEKNTFHVHHYSVISDTLKRLMPLYTWIKYNKTKL